ncbi:hypothetical protein SEPL_417 [Salmonella phage SE_PL]|nr:hypothetical protein CPT_Munch_001 [Salmonella phage Munch]EAR2661079.1 hypothetical protein [Salmonella enterica]EBU7866200.1 hypothetical protein [Salmonella enterica subsp. enterica serovar Kentucky]ECV9083945.1 hypothetical protein [Salmonella enterica subsp. enterica serovar Infantis]MCP0435962.1 hypothetical protein [Salmonella enterica subsp. enterica serovar Mbandaka]QCW18668.1 hypothetical protein 7t3_0147 [Salmonella phage 7t3]QIG63030.1 hypothetical protein SEPL_417 [Salmonella 
MIRIVRINYSTGEADKVAVIVSEKNDDHLHNTLMRFVSAVDRWASIEYLETFKVPAVQLNGHDIKAIWNADEMIANM